jgi:phosphatidylethanolamine-binding protein (PEBP) family uncharacterized protein
MRRSASLFRRFEAEGLASARLRLHYAAEGVLETPAEIAWNSALRHVACCLVNQEEPTDSRETFMRRTAKAFFLAVLPWTLVIAGCGSTSPTAQSVPGVSIPFSSPAISGAVIPAAYTCDGRDISPPLRWGTMPPGVKSVALFVLGFVPLSQGGERIVVEWAVAGLNPALRQLRAGGVPRTADIGIAQGGRKRYSLCPRRGEDRHYRFLLYGVPGSIRIPRRFKAGELLDDLASSRSTYGIRYGGSFPASYTRKS